MMTFFMFVVGAAVGGGLGSTLISRKYVLISIFYHSLCFGMIVWDRGFHLESLLYCFVLSILFFISIFDIQFYKIHPKLLFALFLVSVLHLCFVRENYLEYFLGFAAVSGFLCMLLLFFPVGTMGGGDLKLLAVLGLLVGLRGIITAFSLACVITLCCWNLQRLKGKKERQIAMAPYFTAGIVVALLWGEEILVLFWK